MVRPTTGRPCCCSTAATTELSTPPLMATATSSWAGPSASREPVGSMSKWVTELIESILAGFGEFAIRGRQFTQSFDDAGNDAKTGVNFRRGGGFAEAEANAGAGIFSPQSDGGEHVRRFDGAGGAGRSGGAGDTF